MKSYIHPVTDPSDLNDDEALAGYRAVLGFTAINHTQKSASYWHGYRNGMVDTHQEPIDQHQQEFARKIVIQMRA